VRKIAVALMALAAATGLAQASTTTRAAACGLPDAKPLWIDYAEGSVSFRNDVFGRPGVIAATSGIQNAQDLRDRGAQTIYWWMKLNKLAGTPGAPTDPATIPAAVDDVVQKAVDTTLCQTPVVILNELNSAGTTTPWTDTNGQYRANVLDVLRRLVERGATPILLISARPYTGGDALGWWQQAGQLAILAREVYFPAPPTMRTGVIIGSRTMRQRFRDGIQPLAAIGIPRERLALVLGFQSGPGKGGREGLQPTSSWLRLVKLEALAARQAATELGLAAVISWGWGTFDQAGADADKPKAACVYLWARDRDLCDGPAAGGAGFNASLDEGQISLPGSDRCVLDGVAMKKSEVNALARVTHNTEVALSALFARTIESKGHPVSTARVLALEQSIVDVRFGGRRAAYVAALRARGASVAVARAIVADELRRRAISRGLRVTAPTAAEVALYYTLYGSLPTRQVKADRAPAWLGGRKRGYALVPPGPSVLLTLPSAVAKTIVTEDGSLRVTPLDESLPLGVVPPSLAAPAVRAALVAQARIQAFQAWTARAQGNALSRIRCVRDVLPTAAAVDLASYLPFLALDT
jgi:hypothetical protein